MDLVSLYTLVHPDTQLTTAKADTDTARIQLIKVTTDEAHYYICTCELILVN